MNTEAAIPHAATTPKSLQSLAPFFGEILLVLRFPVTWQVRVSLLENITGVGWCGLALITGWVQVIKKPGPRITSGWTDDVWVDWGTMDRKTDLFIPFVETDIQVESM